MVDFVKIAYKSPKRGVIEIYPKYLINDSKDLMTRGSDFYAVWDEDTQKWSTNEMDAIGIIDRELDKYAAEHRDMFTNDNVIVSHLWDADTGQIDKWHKFVQKQKGDSFHPLDEKLIFSNDTPKKEDYSSKSLSYPLAAGPYPAFDKIISTLYDPGERLKIEWAIGSIVTGDSTWIQKFLVFFGEGGTGKSTILDIIAQLFDGYWASFSSKALASSQQAFALEAFKTNPLVAIEHEGDLSRIEDNTRLNSLVSHEQMMVNEKFKSIYPAKFKAFVILASNKPVMITDSKSGIIRRLIDVRPSMRKLPFDEYLKLTSQIKFELGAIAYHCKEVYLANKTIFNNYIPIKMIGATNDFYNFMVESYVVFKREDPMSLGVAWCMYKEYCDNANVPHPKSKRAFKEEFADYYKRYEENVSDGKRIDTMFYGFRTEKFWTSDNNIKKKEESAEEKPVSKDSFLDFKEQPSVLDEVGKDWLAQYATPDDKPIQKWANVKTMLQALDTSRVHYLKVPMNLIVIDFDIPGDDGEKSLERNLEAASTWPATYAELSKSGCGIHLHYYWEGDPTTLSRVYADHVEIKVYSGLSSLRRKLTKCNALPIAVLSSGLPLQKLKGKSMLDEKVLTNEKGIRTLIKRNLAKEYHGHTKPNIEFIYKILTDAYEAGTQYDVRDMENLVAQFAAQSSHNPEYCLKLVSKMPFKSKDPEPEERAPEPSSYNKRPLVFVDVEVFPNLFLINWKYEGEGNTVTRMINPTPEQVKSLTNFRLVGFNNRRYDNHMLYARILGKTNEELFDLSQKIINGGKTGGYFYREAYNISYTDIYDFSSKKQSLKKWEIELGIHHQELGLPWDKPVPEERWEEVAEYCDNDVLATEAVWNCKKVKSDWIARQILSQLSGLTVNDTTNMHTQHIIFGNVKDPWKNDTFNYRNLADPVPYTKYEYYKERFGEDYDFRVFNDKGEPEYRSYIPGEVLPDGWSILPFFPGYSYDGTRPKGEKSTYKGTFISEGGFVYAEPGMYIDVGLDDIGSMHPHSATAEKIFGKYTKNYEDLMEARMAIKHKDRERLKTLLGGKLLKFYDTALLPNAAFTLDDLAYSLKIAINSVYGLTSAKFTNAFRDPRNNDNIVAKRGALFMLNLKCEVQKRGYTVAHIKTDSIKIPDVTPEILEFVDKYGKEFGYTFEHEATYERMCLVNDAVYIARYDDQGDRTKGGKYANEWTATGTQFQVPYVFKTLFSKEDITFEDICETKSVKTAIYLDMNEGMEDVTPWETLREIRKKEPDKRTKKEESMVLLNEHLNDEQLNELIAKGHNYKFIGKVGQFCPIKEGAGGGLLVRDQEGQMYSVTGSKGYRWIESERVKVLNKEKDIDLRYYDELVNEAVAEIGKYGDVEWFCSESATDKINMPAFMNIPECEEEELPFEDADEFCSQNLQVV